MNNTKLLDDINYYKNQEDYENMAKHFILYINNMNHSIPIQKFNMLINNYVINKSIKYYEIEVDNNSLDAMYILGNYYYINHNYSNMLKYYSMAIDKNHAKSMNSLARYYKRKNDYTNMIKYYLMAIQNGSKSAMYNLGLYYERNGDKENIIKYYLMAIEHGDLDATYNLGSYYENNSDTENMIKYYKMLFNNTAFFIEKNNFNHAVKILNLYSKMDDFDENKFIELCFIIINAGIVYGAITLIEYYVKHNFSNKKVLELYMICSKKNVYSENELEQILSRIKCLLHFNFDQIIRFCNSMNIELYELLNKCVCNNDITKIIIEYY
jgi:tetratricopeptide (TPR) repeat protein